MTITLNGTTGITTPALTNSGALTQTGAATLSSTLQAATTIGVGGATPSASGAGITFPATASASSDANTLDDYEEGTWTPSVGGNATYNNRSGYYTKIGNLVYAYCLLNINTIGTGSTTAISGLPFSSLARSQGSMAYFSNLTPTVVFLSPYAEGTSIFFIGATSATTNVNDAIAIFKNSAYVILAVTYFV